MALQERKNIGNYIALGWFTWLKNHPRRGWTRKNPGDRTLNQIDFILFHEQFRNALTSCKSMPGAHRDSDHVPVVGTMRIKLKKKTAKENRNSTKTTTQHVRKR